MASIDTGDGSSFSLNLFPMLDIFSILICFLLMNYSTQGASAESQVEDMEMPTSEVTLSLDSAASVSITQNKMIIQGSFNKALEIPIEMGEKGKDLPSSFLSQGAIPQAYEIFKILRENAVAVKNRDKTLDLNEHELSTLVLEADKGTPFQLLRRVMLTAQQAEIISWQLSNMKASID